MRYYVVDAFTDALFGGNPAGVCPLAAWPDEVLMQNIARENNLSETAFVVKNGAAYDLRWFTPAVEIDLCGHATLATAYVLSRFHEAGTVMEFKTRSGLLRVEKRGDWLEMNFPVRRRNPVKIDERMKKAVSGPLLAAHVDTGGNLMLEMAGEAAVREARPDIAEISRMTEYHGVVLTAAGGDCDFASRFFAPRMGIDEDPVTGSTHTSLTPFWAEKLGKTEMSARQLSARGGLLRCRLDGERVSISGQARLYLVGELQIEP